jgi:hypothetical protein
MLPALLLNTNLGASVMRTSDPARVGVKMSIAEHHRDRVAEGITPISGKLLA